MGINMKSMIGKSTLREIRQSLGRYLAILAIVALGVGFLSGLRASKPSMVETGDKYFKNQVLYDFRLISTLGFDEKSIENIRKRTDVRTVEGAYSFDVICKSGSQGNANVMRMHSLTEGINEPELVAGRLPQKADECLVDASMFSYKYIGKKLKVSEDNAEEDLEHFAYRDYKIVGVVRSPLYCQFERGNTALGNGTVAGFGYLLPEGFVSEAYTEVYVKLTEDFYLYSEEYTRYIDEKIPKWEAYLEELSKDRYAFVLEDGNKKIADAKIELHDAKADGESQLKDAKEELDRAADEIEDGKVKLEEGKKEIADGWEKIRQEEKKLDDAISEIAKNEKLLLDKETELEEGIVQWKEGKDKLLNSEEELLKAQELLDTKETELNNGALQLAEKEAELLAGEEQLGNTQKAVDAGLQAISDRRKELLEEEQKWLDSIGVIPPDVKEENDAERERLDDTEAILLNTRQEMEKQLPVLEDGRKQLEAAKTQINNGRTEINNAKTQLENGKKEIKSGKEEVASSWETIKDGRKQIREGREELLKARAEVENGKLKLAEAKADLEEGEKEIAEKEQELLEGEQEYLDGLAEYEKGMQEFEKEIADAQEKLSDAESKLRKIEEPDNYLLGRDTNVGYVMFENDAEIVEKISVVFPIFFFLVAALVCMTTMSRMIEEQRTQIGTLKALGYSKYNIMGKYVAYSGSAALVGCLVGYFIGVLVFPSVIWMGYAMMYDIGRLQLVFDWKVALLCILASLLCSVGTTWYSCYKELNEVAAQLMRPKTPEAGKRILLERIGFIWNRLKFLQKVSIRNVFRYKKRFLMMVIGISGCVALMVAGFGVKDSIANIMGYQYDTIQTYDLSVSLNREIEKEERENLSHKLGNDMEAYALLQESAVDFVTKEEVKSVNLIIPQQKEGFSEFIQMYNKEGQKLSMPEKGECIIVYKLSRDYGVQVGDMITLRTEDYETVEVKVTGIMENYVYNYIYIHPDTYREQVGKTPEFKTIYVKANKDSDKRGLAASFMKEEYISAVTINEDVKARFDTLMSNLDYIVLLVLGCAAMLAFIVIYNLTNINITERIREIATIKVLGFTKQETATYVFRENLIMTFVGALVGLCLGKVLHTFIMDCIKIDLISFDVRIRGISYVYSLVLSLVFALLINKFMSSKLEKISMTESLKSVD